MTSQPGKQTILKYILPNISKSKGNQTMNFGQLIEKKPSWKISKCSVVSIPRPFSKN